MDAFPLFEDIMGAEMSTAARFSLADVLAEHGDENLSVTVHAAELDTEPVTVFTYKAASKNSATLTTALQVRLVDERELV